MTLRTRQAGAELSQSLEDYIEAVLELTSTGPKVARVRDIAARLKVGMPSVSVALSTLGQRGLVNYQPYEIVTLTPHGQKVARQVVHRHRVLRAFLEDVLGLSPAAAEANACRMEHAADAEVLGRLETLTRRIAQCPSTCRTFVQSFAQGLCPMGDQECSSCSPRREVRRTKEAAK